jgi:hypothetical protein
MFQIKHYSSYVTDGSSVFSKERAYPLAPCKHKDKQYSQFFMTSDNGITAFVSTIDIKRLMEVPVATKARGKAVLHRSSGKTFGSMKAACEAFDIKLTQLKSSPDFVIA